jgi:hypothetical protein
MNLVHLEELARAIAEYFFFLVWYKGCGHQTGDDQTDNRLVGTNGKRNQTKTYFERSVVHFEDTLQVGDDDEFLASLVVDNLVDATPEHLDAGEM